MANEDKVLISEVGPRDGLQSVAAIMPTETKLAWIDALYDSGIREIEVGSYVPPKLLPQMADVSVVVRHAIKKPGLTVMALVPNLKGAEKALADGVHKITLPVSASEQHSLANVRKTRVEMVEEVKRVVALRDQAAPGTHIEVGISTAFGCTIQGQVSEDDVVWLACELEQAGVDEIGLSDTTGMANPAQVQRLFDKVRTKIGSRTGAGHFHNTRGLGLANCLAAYQVGVKTFDSSQAGLGGCPYAPGASGNVVTEDLIFMFESMGVDTGVDLEKMMRARAIMHSGLPDEPIYGMTPLAGLTKGFVYANGRQPAKENLDAIFQEETKRG